MMKKFKLKNKQNFKYCIPHSIQNPNIQPGVFLNKMTGHALYMHPNQVWAKKMQQLMSFFYLLSFYEFLGVFFWFVISKSLCVNTVLVYYQ